MVDSYNMRVKRISTMADLHRELQQAQLIERNQLLQLKTSMANPDLRHAPVAILRQLNPGGYRNLQMAREVTRLLKVNFYRLSMEIKSRSA